MKKAAVIIGRISGVIELVLAVIFLIVSMVYFTEATKITSSAYEAVKIAYNTSGVSFIISAITSLVGGILCLVAANKVDNAYLKSDVIGWGVVLLLFAVVVAGILVFCSRESEYYGYIAMIKKRRASMQNQNGPLPVSSSPSSIQQPQTNNKEDKTLKNIELLKKYKELLDSGILTQEEFEQKKKELL